MTAPRESAHWGFWGTLAWGLLIAALFLVVQTASSFAVVVLANPGIAAEDVAPLLIAAGSDGNVFAWSVIATTLVCGPAILGAVKLKRGSDLRGYLCLAPVERGTLLKWFGLLAVFAVASDLVTVYVMHRSVVPEAMAPAFASARPLWLLWIALVAGAPLFEELFFRGFLFRGFEASFLGPVGATIATSALWTAIHVQYDAYPLATIFLLGLLFGAARVAGRSTLLPMAMHAAMNVVASLQAALFLRPQP